MRFNLHAYSNIATAQRLQALVALTIIIAETLRISLERRIKAQHTMLQGIGIQLRQDAIQRPALRPQAMHLLQ
ncbi:hypothetical protein D3C84_992030 [compost metagenome]